MASAPAHESIVAFSCWDDGAWSWLLCATLKCRCSHFLALQKPFCIHLLKAARALGCHLCELIYSLVSTWTQ